jgi:hypothetical protein
MRASECDRGESEREERGELMGLKITTDRDWGPSKIAAEVIFRFSDNPHEDL